MAFDASQEQQDDLNQQKQQQAQPGTDAGQTTNLSGGGGGFAGGPSSASQAPGQSAAAPTSGPTSSGSWTNLNNYLTANQDQSQALGNQVSGNVEKQAKQTQSDVGSLSTAFQNQDPYKAINSVSSDQVTQAFADPAKYQNGDTGQALQYLNASYGSPTSDIQSFAQAGTPQWSNIAQEFNQANTNLQGTQTEVGRQGLLRSQYGNNGVGYGQGEQNFDQLLLGANPNNQAQLNSVYNQYAPQLLNAKATKGVDQGSQDQNAAAAAGIPLAQYQALHNAQTYASGENTKAQGYQSQAQGLLGGQLSALQQNVGNEVSQKASQYGADVPALSQALKSGTLTAEQASALGIDPNAHIYNLNRDNLAGNLTVNANPYAGQGGRNLAASQEDFAKFKGLQNLIGGANNNAALVAQLNGIGLTGDYQSAQAQPVANPYSFNKGSYDAAIAAEQQKYNDAYTGQRLHDLPYNIGAGERYGQYASGEGLTPQQIQAQIDDYNKQLQGTPQIANSEAGVVSKLQSALNKFFQEQGASNTLNPQQTGGPLNSVLFPRINQQI